MVKATFSSEKNLCKLNENTMSKLKKKKLLI